MKYYLKKCGFQELGSVGADGVVHRGRYLLTSMNENVLSFFPPLTTTQLNDSALLPIISLSTGRKTYCNYIYHNDKFHGSTAINPRNEYRIYLNKTIEEDSQLFKKDDIMVMRKEAVQNGDGEEQTVYLMKLYQDHASEDYAFLDSTIRSYPINGGYGLLDGEIESFELQARQINNIGEAPVLIDETVTNQVVAAPEGTVAELFNASIFRDFVMTGYGNLCAITGTVIRFESYMNLEAAHIKPKSHGGLYLPNNGIPLTRDLHWAFDKGFFTFNDNLEVVVHPQVTSDYLHALEGRRIRTPANPFFAPNLDNIHYHRDNVFGLFLTTGRL